MLRQRSLRQRTHQIGGVQIQARHRNSSRQRPGISSHPGNAQHGRSGAVVDRNSGANPLVRRINMVLTPRVQ